MPLSIVYTTLPTRNAALEMASKLVSQKLAACGNIIPGMTSVYRWEGAIQESEEVVLLLKTRAEQVSPLMQEVKSLHPYDVPCILSWNLESAAADFESWVVAETSPGPDERDTTTEFEV